LNPPTRSYSTRWKIQRLTISLTGFRKLVLGLGEVALLERQLCGISSHPLSSILGQLVSPLARNEREPFSFPLSRCPKGQWWGPFSDGSLDGRRGLLSINSSNRLRKLLLVLQTSLEKKYAKAGRVEASVGNSTRPRAARPLVREEVLLDSSEVKQRNVDPKRLRTKKPISAGASAQVVRPQRRDTGYEFAKSPAAPHPCGIFISLA
jgi:hypothetical protein